MLGPDTQTMFWGETFYLISGQMTSIAQSNTSRLGFSTLITALCGARGVVSDSLTFKLLSPIINLAYIRKNCWNPEDLTVSIRGARRARARSVELPSTFAAPTPASFQQPPPKHSSGTDNFTTEFLDDSTTRLYSFY